MLEGDLARDRQRGHSPQSPAVVLLLAEDLIDEPVDGAPAPTSIDEVNRRLRLSALERIEEARVDIRAKMR